MKDSEWIYTIIQKNRARGSYVPGKQIQELRQFSRRYVRLCEQSTHKGQEIDCQLHRCNIQITNYATKIGSTSVIKVVKAIIEGETTVEVLEKHVHRRIRNKNREENTTSHRGIISTTDRFIFNQNIREYEQIHKQQEECLKAIEHECQEHFCKELQLLCTIPGIQKLSAMIIIAELGVDLKTLLQQQH